MYSMEWESWVQSFNSAYHKDLISLYPTLSHQSLWFWDFTCSLNLLDSPQGDPSSFGFTIAWLLVSLPHQKLSD